MQILKEEVNKAILDTAQCLFLELGYEKTTMLQIAKKAGISKSNLYNYFDDKESIFDALTNSSAEKFINLIRYFESNSFEPKFFEVGFLEMMYEQIYLLIMNDKEGLLLIVNSATGTKYANLKSELSKKIADKFMRDYASSLTGKDVLVDYIVHSLFNGIAEIVKQSKTEKELEINLKDFIQYHLSGFNSITK